MTTEPASSSHRIRAFVAVPLDDSARAELLRVQRLLERAARKSTLEARFLAEAQMHLTLKFLGYLEAERVEALKAALERHALQCGPIETSFAGLVAFGSARRARVIAASLSDVDRRLAGLAECFEVEAEKLGIPRETRAYHPHITLCRIKRPGDVSEWLTKAALSQAALTMNEVILYRSELRRSGAEYTAIARARLGEREAP